MNYTDYDSDRLLNFAINRLKNDLPLPLDMETELVSRGFDVEALRELKDVNQLGFSFAEDAGY